MSIFSTIWNAIKMIPGPSADAHALLSAKPNPEHLDWQNSIVDLMKLLGLDSSLSARADLAHELGYPGKIDGSAAMNEWLHEQVMAKVTRGELK